MGQLPFFIEFLKASGLYEAFLADCPLSYTSPNAPNFPDVLGTLVFTTKDLKRCRIISRLVALVYNWWSLYARLINPEKHHEAITSRPLMLQSVGRKTTHAGQTAVTVTSTHAKISVVIAAMQELTTFFKDLVRNVEQLTVSDKVRLIAQRAFRKLLTALPPLPRQKLLPATG